MKGKYLHRVRKRLIISTLTVLCIMSQLGNLTVMAATNKDIVATINEVGHQVVVVIDEDEVKTKKAEFTPSNTRASKKMNSNRVQTNKTTKTTKNSSIESYYSSDGMYYYGRDGKKYPTTKYFASKNKALQKDIESYIGVNSLYKDTVYHPGFNDPNTPLWDAYYGTIRKAVTNKKMKLELGDIAVKNGLVNKNDTKASHLIALFTYYGIINTEDGLLDYSNSTKAYLTREQGHLILARYMRPRSYYMMDGGQKMVDMPGYKNFDNRELAGAFRHSSNNALISVGHSEKDAITSKELKTTMTRLEFISIIMTYFPTDLQRAYDPGGKKAIKTFTDINKKDIVTEKYLDSNGFLYTVKESKEMGNWEDTRWLSATNNQIHRQTLKDKKFYSTAAVMAAYKLGILTKDSKGKANLFEPITMSQALRMLVAASEAQASGKAYDYKGE